MMASTIMLLLVVAVVKCMSLTVNAIHFQNFDSNHDAPFRALEALINTLQKEVVDIRKEVHTRMDTMKYELTCEIRNMKEALSKEREEMSVKVDQVGVEMADFKKKLKRGLRRVGMQSDDIKGELRSQKAELFAVRNSVYDAREEVVDKTNMLLQKVNSTNSSVVVHLTDLRAKLYKINHNLAFISDEHTRMMQVVTRRFRPTNKSYTVPEDYDDGGRILPGCTYTPLDTHELGLDTINNKTFFNDSLGGIPRGGPVGSGGGRIGPLDGWGDGDGSGPPANAQFPTMPEDCNNDKQRYLEYPPFPVDCKAVFDQGFMEDGVYRIKPPDLATRDVYCDQHTAGGGWTVAVLRRKLVRHISFNRSWHEYEVGFGDPRREYWIGLKALHSLTKGRPHQLRADMEDWEGNNAWASYNFFSVAGPEDKYRLRISGYSGTAGDSMRHSHLQMFSTVDHDNDQEDWGSCARGRGGGGWWWGRCACTQPTGQYRRGRYQGPERGVTWWHWKDSNYSLKTLVLKFRPLE
ncbi:hypothetical protein Pcinc_036935 [Petrolisthes cinctipes]|uniref:Fibrinogen C-terminal domain-containing protein n=2 Tax=Petrolisthes TaxID=84661 RepID=A0AAE1BWP3_PETCI|nr:hypothetical protein Pcinc_036935 [Petrolisthes cinctipes]